MLGFRLICASCCSWPCDQARPGLRLDHLHTLQYDIHVHLPPSMPRTETYLDSALYLAMISAVTGWVADPQASQKY
jgi:hypothetical protein